MMQQQGQSLFGRVLLLKNLDSLLDFSKSTVQLEVLIYLGTIGKELTAKEISRGLRIRLKSVYDALTKLSYKGLVEKTDNHKYRLTSKGRNYFRELSGLFGGGDGERKYSRTAHPPLWKSIIAGKYVYDAMMVLGFSERNELPVRMIAKELNLSEETVKSYIELMANPRTAGTPVFSKVMKNYKGRQMIFYRLTEHGIQELSRFSEYRKIKKNPVLNMLMKITKTKRIENAFKRLSLISSGSMLALMISYAITKIALLIPIAGAIAAYVTSAIIFASREY